MTLKLEDDQNLDLFKTAFTKFKNFWVEKTNTGAKWSDGQHAGHSKLMRTYEKRE